MTSPSSLFCVWKCRTRCLKSDGLSKLLQEIPDWRQRTELRRFCTGCENFPKFWRGEQR